MYNAPVMKDLFFGVMPVSNTQWSYIWEMRDGLYIFTNHKRQQWGGTGCVLPLPGDFDTIYVL